MTTARVEELGRRLRTVLGSVLGNVELASPLRPLRGGAFSEMFTFALRDPPVEWSGRLVLRLMPWPAEQVRVEAGMQAGARAAGLPAPHVLFVEPLDGPLGTPFMVMEFLAGRPFLAGITWYRFARDFPKMLRSWPTMFAETLALLASADTAPVFETLARHGVSADAASTTRHLAWIDQTLGSKTGYDEAVQWLKAHQPPPPDRLCVVHGDLWPSNVFTSGKHITGLVDWTTGAVGDPVLDVGYARVGLALMPEPFPPPPPIRGAIHAAGVRLAQQIQGRCASLVGGNDRVAYYEALRCMVQITVVHAERQRGAKSPWARGLPALIRHINSVTGLQLPGE